MKTTRTHLILSDGRHLVYTTEGQQMIACLVARRTHWAIVRGSERFLVPKSRTARSHARERKLRLAE